MAWQAMKRAPRNGEAVLLWSDLWEMSWGIQIGWFENGEWICGEGTAPDDTEDGPTCWMELPDTPDVCLHCGEPFLAGTQMDGCRDPECPQKG